MTIDPKDFTFLDPGDLSDGVVSLQLAETRPAEPAKGHSPRYAFRICDAKSGALVGHLRFRLGDAEDLRLYAGHIGYGILPEHRGHRFAAHAVRLVTSLARRHGMAELWVTCDPENVASRRTCELAGAELIEIIDLPPDIDMYQDGERQKCRYRLATQR